MFYAGGHLRCTTALSGGRLFGSFRTTNIDKVARPGARAAVLTGALAASLGATVLPVQADNECGRASGGMVTCNPTTYTNNGNDYIRYSNQNGLTIVSDGVNLRVTPSVSNRQGVVARTGSGGTGFTGDFNLTWNSGNITVGDPNTIGNETSVQPGRSGSGLLIENRGQGATTLAMNGGEIVVYGYNAQGIYGWQRNNNPDNTADVTVGFSGDSSIETHGRFSAGVYGRTDTGLGNVLVTATDGTIRTTGRNSHGVRGYNRGGATGAAGGVTVSIADLGITTEAEGSYGVAAENESDGNATVSVANSTVVTMGLDADGIHALAENAGVYAVDVSGGSLTSGTGQAAGIRTISSNGGTVTVDETAIIDSSDSGIAFRDGDLDRDGVDEIGGDTMITTAGTVTGDAVLGLGDDTFTLSGGSYTGDVYGDDVVAGAVDGDDTFNWTGGSFGSAFFGANGSDTANVTSVAYDGTHHVFDGGDDVSAADGFVDVLTFTGITADANGANIINWEDVIIDNSEIDLLDGALTVGSEAGNGLFLRNNGVLNMGSAFALTGNLSTASGGLLQGAGAGAGVFSITGGVDNGGTISLRDGAAGDILTITGDYNGSGGTLALDTTLDDDASATDRLVVTGNSTGTTTLLIANAGGGGDVTQLGIEVITVGGTSTGTFDLQGDFVTDNGDQAVVAGAFAYTLHQTDDGDWILLSEDTTPVTPPITPPITPPTPPITPPTPPTGPMFQPGAPIYESLPDTLQQLQRLPSLRQRAGDRNLAGSGRSLGFAAQGAPLAAPFWVRLDGVNRDHTPDFSTTSARSDSRVWSLNGGVDLTLNEGQSGDLVGGVSLHYGTVTSDITSPFGNGAIDSTGYGFGLTATYLGHGGFYADGQLRYTVFDSDLRSDTLGALTAGNDGDGFAASLEIGQAVEIGTGLVLTPQAQLSWAEVDFDTFIGPANERVSLVSADSLELRLGLGIDRIFALPDGGSQTLYTTFDLMHEFEGRSIVNVAGTPLVNEDHDWSAQIGLGARYSWDGASSVFGEFTYNTALDDFHDSRALRATIGARLEF